MKLWYVYGGTPYQILGTVEATCETNRHPQFPGAQEKAALEFGPGCDVVNAGHCTTPRRGNIPRYIIPETSVQFYKKHGVL